MRPPFRLPVAFAYATALTLLVAWVLWIAGGYSLADALESYLLTNTLTALAFSITGAVILRYRPGQLIGRLFCLVALCFVLQAAATGVLGGPFRLPPGPERALTLFANLVWSPAPLALLPLVLQLFPDGRALSRPWRRLVPVTVAAGLTAGVALLFAPGPITDEPIADPSPILTAQSQPVVDVVITGSFAATLACWVLSVVALGVRLHRSRGEERLQLQWFASAVALYVLLNLERELTGEGPILLLVTIPLIPVAAMIAISRHRLYGIHLVLNRALVYAVLTLGVVATYVALIALLGLVAQENLDASPLITTAVIALAFAPARHRLQRAVDRLLYGESRDPATTVARVGAHLGADLEGVLDAVCAAMRLPYAAIVSDGRLLASVGGEPAGLHAMPLDLGAGEPARLLVGLRPGESELSAVDRRALALLAGPLAVAVRSVRLSAELSSSRTRIVAAREDERRRLRRDLHDGLGTALTAVRLKADAASNLIATEPARSTALLEELRGDLNEAIVDVRRLVYGLRPPALDDLGLVAALRQAAEQSWRRDVAPPFQVTVTAPDSMPALPAAVELAVYRIATESVTNSLRHGAATTCRITIRVDEALHLEVLDDGPCRASSWTAGVGLRSMHERAGELGGLVTAGPTDQGGRVHARVPLSAL